MTCFMLDVKSVEHKPEVVCWGMARWPGLCPDIAAGRSRAQLTGSTPFLTSPLPPDAGGRDLAFSAIGAKDAPRSMTDTTLSPSLPRVSLGLSDIAILRHDVRGLEGRREPFRLADERLSGRLGATEHELRRKEAGSAGLAARVLESVFTVETSAGLGAGFAGWVADGTLHVVTAAHVVSELGERVTLERDNGSWGAEVIGRDARRDLAVLRVSGLPVGAAVGARRGGIASAVIGTRQIRWR